VISPRTLAVAIGAAASLFAAVAYGSASSAAGQAHAVPVIVAYNLPATGPAPRFDPGPAGIDAYLWIKDPGASDGPCRGGPPAGQFWPQYAAALEQAGLA
jgi:cellulase/cellobiase CelA1